MMKNWVLKRVLDYNYTNSFSVYHYFLEFRHKFLLKNYEKVERLKNLFTGIYTL